MWYYPVLMSKSPNKPREIKVFIASPGDLSIERRAFKDTIDVLNGGFGRGAHVTFTPLGWEDALATTGRRSQDVINKDVDDCDVFVLVMWRRWGQEAPDAAARGFASYTEEEFYRALARFEKTKSPTICVFFKHIDSGQMADPGEQLTRVLAFRKKLEQSRQVLYRGFTDEAAFKQEIDKHLTAFANGEMEPVSEPITGALLPDSAIAEIEKLRAEAKRNLERAEKAEQEAKTAKAQAEAAEAVGEAKAAKKAVALAESAAKAALDGKIEEARQDFAKALDGTTNIDVLFLGYEFFKRIGELDEAERLLRRWLSISGPDKESGSTADAYGNLGLIEQMRGNLDAAEAYHKKSLVIEEKLGRQEGLSSDYGHLGLIEQTRGNLDAAEAYHKKSLAIEEKLGRQKGMATDYGNLGNIEVTRGNLDMAESYHKKALAIDEKLGNQEGLARHNGNLGVIEARRGNLDAAEAYCRKSLAIDEKIGSQEGIARHNGNLGLIEQARGNLEAAEDYLNKALAINEKLGRLEGIAIQYANLGRVANDRKDFKTAREWWVKARDLDQRIGMPHMVAEMDSWLEGLPPEGGEGGGGG